MQTNYHFKSLKWIQLKWLIQWFSSDLWSHVGVKICQISNTFLVELNLFINYAKLLLFDQVIWKESDNIFKIKKYQSDALSNGKTPNFNILKIQLTNLN